MHQRVEGGFIAMSATATGSDLPVGFLSGALSRGAQLFNCTYTDPADVSDRYRCS